MMKTIINWRSLLYMLLCAFFVGYFIGLILPSALSIPLSFTAGAALGWYWPWPIIRLEKD